MQQRLRTGGARAPFDFLFLFNMTFTLRAIKVEDASSRRDQGNTSDDSCG